MEDILKQLQGLEATASIAYGDKKNLVYYATPNSLIRP